MDPITGHSPMTLNEYQKMALRTSSKENTSRIALAILAIGLCGESGEVAELLKKYIGHGHDLCVDDVLNELGDVLWYVASLAEAMDSSLESVASMNITKLMKRYPHGFSEEASRNRDG